MGHTKFERWEWLSRFKIVNLEDLPPYKFQIYLLESMTHLNMPNTKIIYGLISAEDGYFQKAKVHKKLVTLLQDISETTNMLFQFLYKLKNEFCSDVRIVLGWNDCSIAVFEDQSKSPLISSHVEKITLTPLKRTYLEGGHYQDEEMNNIVIGPAFQPLLGDIKNINLNMFLKCEECSEIYFHWKKRKRKYCSKACQNRAGVKRHRKKTS